MEELKPRDIRDVLLATELTLAKVKEDLAKVKTDVEDLKTKVP